MTTTEVTYLEALNVMREKTLQYDAKNEFPYENFHLIRSMSLQNKASSKKYGGSEIGFEELSYLISDIASSCSSTALCLAMHYYTIGGLRNILSTELKDKIFSDVKNGAFFASFNYPIVQTITKNFRPKDIVNIEAVKTDDGYLLNGTKMFVSGAPIFKYIPIYAFHSDQVNSLYGVSAFIVDKEMPGVSVHESWNFNTMKSSKGHHISLDGVKISEDALVGREGFGIEDTQDLMYWSRAAISSVYLGIAKAGIDYIKEIVMSKYDNISNKPLAFLPGVQFKYADMRIKYEASKDLLVSYTRQADLEMENGNFTNELFEKSLIIKQFVAKAANEIIWDAMQIEGMRSLQSSSFLEKLYRDVRAGLFHQPGEDLLKETLAKKSLGILTRNNRWL